MYDDETPAEEAKDETPSEEPQMTNEERVTAIQELLGANPSGKWDSNSDLALLKFRRVQSRL